MSENALIKLHNMLVSDKTYSDWVIDSGCTHHMSSNKKWFANRRVSREGFVLMG